MLANPFSERCAFVQGACRSSRIESKLATAAPLHDLGPLVLGELVEDAVCELALRALISPVVEGTDLGSVFVELPPQQVVIGGLAGEAVPIPSSTTATPPAATRSRTRSIPGRSRLAPLCPGSDTSSRTS